MIDKRELRIGNWVNCHNMTFMVGIIEETYVEPIGRNDGGFAFDDLIPVPLTPDILVKAGFYQLPHFTVGDNWLMDFGIQSQISISCLNTPNFMMWICSVDENKKVTDLVCIWNWDVRGEMFTHHLQNLIRDLTGQELAINLK